jgi:capsular polysaccharide transport system permease protein
VHGANDAIDALRVGEYQSADDILTALGASKREVAPRLRLLWALTQILRRNMGEGVHTLLEVIGQGTRGESIYQRLQRIVGPLETMFPADAALEIRLRVGDYFLRQERADEATPWLEDARSAWPDDPLAIYLEASCRVALYGERRAILEMEAVLEQAAADRNRAYFIGGGTAALWYRLGLIYERMRNLDRAAYYLARSVQLTGESLSQRLLLGDVLMRMGRFEEAIAQLEAIPRSAENYRYAARLRAIARFRIGDTETALALLHEVAEIDPLDALTFLELGRIYLAIGHLQEAEVALARAFRTNPDLPTLKSAMIALERELGRLMDPDAGLPPPDAFDIPAEFALRLDDPAFAQRASLHAGMASYFRVLGTIMLRDILSKHRHTGMGYLWAILEPLGYIMALDIVFHMEGRQATHGISVEAYLITGIATYFFFYSHVSTAVSSAVTSNANLLYFREVSPLVLIVASGLREFLTALVVLVIVVAGLSLYENALQVNDPLTLLAALGSISAIALVVGVFFGFGELAVPALQIVRIFFTRFMFFFSGAFFLANGLTPQVRYWALLNPLVDLFEFVRDGMFSTYHSRYAEWSYPLYFIMVGVPLILVLDRATRRYVLAPS